MLRPALRSVFMDPNQHREEIPVPRVPGGSEDQIQAPIGVNVEDLKRRSIRGGAVTMVSQAISISIQLVSTVVLARLLTPDDYGVIAMVLTVTGFAGLFRELGLSSAAIQKSNLTHFQQSNLFWLNAAMGAAVTVVVAAIAPLVAWFYSRPDLTLLTLILSAGFVIGGVGTQHGANLLRNMQFGRNAAANIGGAVVTLIVSIVLASAGYSFWALAWATLCGSLTTTILLSALSSFRPGWISRGSGLREMLKFGANVTGYDFVNYFARNADNLLIGRFWGAGPLGLYSRAYALLMLPINSFRGPVTSVGFSALSRLQDHPEPYRKYYRKACQILAGISMPLTAFLFAASGGLIHLMLGPAWAEVVPIFEVLALVALVQPVITLWGMVLLSRGKGARYFHLGIFNAGGYLIGFLGGMQWGAIGVAWGYAIATYAMAYPTIKWAFEGTPLSFRDLGESIWRPLVASALAAGASRGLLLVAGDLTAIQHVLICGLGFGVVYLGVLGLLPGGRSELHAIRGLALMWTRIK